MKSKLQINGEWIYGTVIPSVWLVLQIGSICPFCKHLMYVALKEPFQNIEFHNLRYCSAGLTPVSLDVDRKSNFVSPDWGVPEFGVRVWGVCGVMNANMVTGRGGGRYIHTLILLGQAFENTNFHYFKDNIWRKELYNTDEAQHLKRWKFTLKIKKFF